VNRSVLVVDDDADVRRLAQVSLTRIGGHDVITVASGQECLDHLQQHRPDAIVLDVMMPGLDGPSTLLAIRDGATTYDIPVVFLTAGVVEADVERLRSLPVSGVLNKPFDPLVLPAELAAILGW
jgi:CheY-like chemotaxis protein